MKANMRKRNSDDLLVLTNDCGNDNKVTHIGDQNDID